MSESASHELVPAPKHEIPAELAAFGLVRLALQP